MMIGRSILSVIACLFSSINIASCNLYNPHIFPSTGPFFEGWYIRISDVTNRCSYGLLFGSVLPKKGVNSTRPAFVGLLLQEEGKQLKSWSAFPAIETVQITVDGHPVTKNPNRLSPANFTWSAPSVGFIHVNDKQTVFKVHVGSVNFSGEIGPVKPWAANGEGPAGAIDDLPLPLHWFVYSTRSTLQQSSWHDINTNKVITSHSGLVHMEKNWGKSFPAKWIWSQGITSDGNQSYALSYGPIIGVTGFLFGYKNHKNERYSCNFTPVNSVLTKHVENGCAGNVIVTISGLHSSVEITINATKKSFSKCLYGPESSGFNKCASESYAATTMIKVYTRNFWLQWKLVDKIQMKDTALEFGGQNMCDPTCRNG